MRPALLFRLPVALAALWFALACGGTGAPDTTPSPPDLALGPTPAPTPTPAPAPTPAPDGARITADAARAMRADPAAFFTGNCHGMLPPDPDIVWDEDYPPAGDECTYREFDQNCSPDMSGCWSKSEACRDACAEPCTACQGRCAETCDACSTGCGADAACAAACGQARAACRDTCMAQTDTCRGPECAAVETTCEAEAEARKVRLCPDCTAIAECEMAAMSDGRDWQECGSRFPSDDAECMSLCFPGY